MAQWEGKSKGTPLGYRIFVGILRYLGLWPAYVLLTFVVLYYFLFSWSSTRHIYSFFRRRMHFGIAKSVGMVYWNYFMLGQSLIDKVAILSGLSARFTSHSNGAENIERMAAARRGAIMLGAHLGNWEIAGHFIARYDTVINVLMYDGEHEHIKALMESVIGGKKFNVIPIREDLSHVYLMSEALARGETICMHADRYVQGARAQAVEFMGEPALFPTGPFQLVKALKAPFTYVYGVKTGPTHYEFYARPPKEVSDFANLDAMMKDYVTDLEGMVNKAPSQWFNYYNFWKK
ncbi:MAG: lipid A biosynthesis acyltransferase [Bacteroidetes bacterium]|nr:lipid A biosynthesis acyltransferase [Bacteroidota bacterium]